MNINMLCMEKCIRLKKGQMKCKKIFFFIFYIFYSVILASFGGLLMSLKGNSQYLKKIQNDTRIYLLIKNS